MAAARVLLDLDPACPRIRIVGDHTGKFPLGGPVGRAAKGEFYRILRLGRRSDLPAEPFEPGDAPWAIGDEPASIDIDLPREMRLTHTVTKPVGVPSNSSSGGRTTSITLPGRAKESV